MFMLISAQVHQSRRIPAVAGLQPHFIIQVNHNHSGGNLEEDWQKCLKIPARELGIGT